MTIVSKSRVVLPSGWVEFLLPADAEAWAAEHAPGAPIVPVQEEVPDPDPDPAP